MINAHTGSRRTVSRCAASPLRRFTGLTLAVLGIPNTLYFFFGLSLGWGIYFGTLFVTASGVFMTTLGFLLLKTDINVLGGRFKAFKRFTAFCLLLFILSFILVEGLIVRSAVTVDTEDTDYLIVLGAALIGDKPTLDLKYRLDAAVEYLSENPNARVIVSGGQGKDESISEAQAMEKYFLSRGIDKGRIIKESRSSNTYENIKFSKELIQSFDKRDRIRVTIISNDFHIFRAKLLAERQGLEAYGYPAGTPLYIIPCHYSREYFAVVKSLISSS